MLLRKQGGNSSAVLIAFVRSSDGAFVWQASQLTGAHSELTPAPDNATAARAQEFEQVRDLKNLQSLSAAENRGTVTNLVIAADSNGKLLILKVVANPPVIAASVVKEQLLSQRGDVFSSVALSACPGTVTVDCIVQLAVQCGATGTSGSGCKVELRLWANATAEVPALLGLPLLLNSTLAPADAANVSGSVAAVDIGHQTAASPCVVSGSNAVAALLSYSVGGRVFAGLACYRSMGPGVVSAALNGPSQIAVGDAPSVSMATVPGKGIVAIETHQNGFCQNNEPQNKAPRPAMCEQTPRPTPGVLVYSYGALSEWAALLAAKQPMNACHERLMHVSTTTTICFAATAPRIFVDGSANLYR